MPHLPTIRCAGRDRPVPPQPVGPPRAVGAPAADWVRISELVAAGGTTARTLFGDDPMLGGAATGVPVRSWAHGRARQRPVLLLESADPLMARDPRSGRSYDLQAELLAMRGFRRFSTGSPPYRPLPGWTLTARPSGLELCDGAGNAWACPRMVTDPRWAAAADGYGSVLVLYGAWLGVGTPRGVAESQYGPTQRAAELDLGRSQGLVVAASVHWRRSMDLGRQLPR